MNLDIKLFNDKGKKINLSVLIKEIIHPKIPNSPSEERFLDDLGQLIETSNLIFFGKFNLEEKENYNSSNGSIHLDYLFKDGEKIPKEADFIVVDKLLSSQSTSRDVNKRFRSAYYARIERNVNNYNNSKFD